MDVKKMYTLHVEPASDNDVLIETCAMEVHDHELSAFPDVYELVKGAAAGPVAIKLPPTVTIGNMEWVISWVRRKTTVSAIMTKAEFQQLAILADYLSMQSLLNDLTVSFSSFLITND